MNIKRIPFLFIALIILILRIPMFIIVLIFLLSKWIWNRVENEIYELDWIIYKTKEKMFKHDRHNRNK